MKDSRGLLFETLQVFHDTTPRDGAEQMALDEAILESASHPVLRVYCWSEAAVSFGYSQSQSLVVNMFPGRPLVRRLTGGGVVEHGRDWTFSLMVPLLDLAARLRPTETYERIHDAVMVTLGGTEGISARLAGCEDRISGMACFVAPALYDVLAGDGQKLCGGAQRRTRKGFLHQGSIQGVNLPPSFLGALADALARKREDFSLPEEVAVRMQSLTVHKYGSREWREKIP